MKDIFYENSKKKNNEGYFEKIFYLNDNVLLYVYCIYFLWWRGLNPQPCIYYTLSKPIELICILYKR